MDRPYVTLWFLVPVTLCRQALSRRTPSRQTVTKETPGHLLMVPSPRRCRWRTSLLLNSGNMGVCLLMARARPATTPHAARESGIQRSAGYGVLHQFCPATCEGWLATDGNPQGSASVRTGGKAISTRWAAPSVCQRPPPHAPTPKSYNAATVDVLRLSGHISPCGPHATAIPSAA